MKNISRVLVANRGEIAVRIINACNALGIESVAAVSAADRESLPSRMAHRSICIGPSRPLESYLKIDALIAAALGTGAQAIHPGYGFLAEQPELVQACRKYGIIFIGPTEDNIQQMGNKLVARGIVKTLGIATVPGSEKINDLEDALTKAEEIGFPVLVKAAAGGGGRGMKIAGGQEELKNEFDTLSAEVRSAFGDGTLYLEHFIPDGRHIEVQVLGDRFGKIIHLYERDCSVQRRYQKMIEEAPSPAVGDGLREKICAAAVAIAEKIGYQNAGTVEFILDQDKGEFYFLEMNTRIQVEHPVTEQITGVDLVQEQIRLADGEPLGISQRDVRLKGHAIECRVNAESPSAGFAPSPGLIKEWTVPKRDWIRIESHCHNGLTITPFYDSLMAKLIVTGDDRKTAIEQMRFALENFFVSGVETNIPFHLKIMKHPDYLNNKISTRWLEDKVLEK